MSASISSMSVLSVTWKVVQTVSVIPTISRRVPAFVTPMYGASIRCHPIPSTQTFAIPDARMNGCSVLWIWLVNSALACTNVVRM